MHVQGSADITYRMFRTILLTADVAPSRAIEQLVSQSSDLRLFDRALSLPSNPHDAAALVKKYDPEVILLDLSEAGGGSAAIDLLRQQAPKVALIGFSGRSEPQSEEIPTVDRATPQALADAVKLAVLSARPERWPNVYVFLPAKAGNGATTVALNTAASISAAAQRAVLIEADLHSGILSEILNAKPEVPLQRVLADSGQLDSSTLNSAVVERAGVDMLLTDRSKMQPLASWRNYHQLLRFIAPRYGSVLVDLPEVVNDATEEVVRCAARIFIVCTPELASLTLARQRMEELARRHVPEDRIAVVLNRWHRDTMTAEEASAALNAPIWTAIPNDYYSVDRATMAASPLSPGTNLGRAYAAFAHSLTEDKPVAKQKRSLWKSLAS